MEEVGGAGLFPSPCRGRALMNSSSLRGAGGGCAPSGSIEAEAALGGPISGAFEPRVSDREHSWIEIRTPSKKRLSFRRQPGALAITPSSNAVPARPRVQFVARTLRAPAASASPTAWAENFISGASASLLSKLILQPFDTTKTILQGSKQVRGQYNNLLECVVGLVRTKGTLSLYRGLLASVVVSAPSSAVFFTAYEHVKNTVERAARRHQNLGFLHPTAPIVAAALGNVVSSVVRVPPEVIKQRVQAGIHRDMLQAASTIWKDEGVAGFYTGYSSMVSRDIPYAAVQFTVFEALKRRRQAILEEKAAQREGSDNGKLSEGAYILSNLWMGAVSGAIASIVTSPIDVVKTRVMTQQIASGGAYLGMRQTFNQIWVEEGIVAFGRGLAPRLLYKVPASAVFLVCYEGIKRILLSARIAREKKKQQKEANALRTAVDLSPSSPAVSIRSV